MPVSLDHVEPPLQYTLIQSADLVGWDGSLPHPQFQAVVAQLADLNCGLRSWLKSCNPSLTRSVFVCCTERIFWEKRNEAHGF